MKERVGVRERRGDGILEFQDPGAVAKFLATLAHLLFLYHLS